MPKRREVEVEIPGLSPEEAAERLKADTKPALFPSFSNPLRGRGEESLVGRVDAEGFVVSPNESGYKRVVPTADGRFERTELGTRVRAVVGIPAFIVWALRAGYLASLGAVGFAGWQLLTAGESAVFAGLLAGFALLSTAATGWNVHQAEAKIPKLAADLENALLDRLPEDAETMDIQVPEELEDELEERRRSAQASREVER